MFYLLKILLFEAQKFPFRIQSNKKLSICHGFMKTVKFPGNRKATIGNLSPRTEIEYEYYYPLSDVVMREMMEKYPPPSQDFFLSY